MYTYYIGMDRFHFLFIKTIVFRNDSFSFFESSKRVFIFKNDRFFLKTKQSFIEKKKQRNKKTHIKSHLNIKRKTFIFATFIPYLVLIFLPWKVKSKRIRDFFFHSFFSGKIVNWLHWSELGYSGQNRKFLKLNLVFVNLFIFVVLKISSM